LGRTIAGRFPVLSTKRLVLREVNAKDVAWYFRHYNTWKIADGQECPGPKDMKDARHGVKFYFTDSFRNGTGIRWGITLKGSDELIGSTGFYKWDKRTSQVETAYDLDPKHWEKGIMTEAMTAAIDYAFGTMKVNRNEALVSPRNKDSLTLVRRLGFRREGTLREHDVYNGKFTHDFLLALLKRDW